MSYDNMPTVTRRFNGTEIAQRDNGYLNATSMCKASGKSWSHYKENSTTDAFLVELATSIGIPIDVLVVAVTTGLNEDRGTWVHPQVGYHLAQWCSPAFAVQVTEWIHDIRIKGYASAQPSTLNLAQLHAELAQLHAELDELRDLKHEYERSQRIFDLLANCRNNVPMVYVHSMFGIKLRETHEFLQYIGLLKKRQPTKPTPYALDNGLLEFKMQASDKATIVRLFVTPKGLLEISQKLDKYNFPREPKGRPYPTPSGEVYHSITQTTPTPNTLPPIPTIDTLPSLTRPPRKPLSIFTPALSKPPKSPKPPKLRYDHYSYDKLKKVVYVDNTHCILGDLIADQLSMDPLHLTDFVRKSFTHYTVRARRPGKTQGAPFSHPYLTRAQTIAVVNTINPRLVKNITKFFDDQVAQSHTPQH